jgi:competence protein ComEA
VAGEVAAPGVYALPPGSIVQDALNAAGGPAGDADLARLNLAAPLAEGQQVYVPAQGETLPVASGSSAAAGGQQAAPSGPINVNTATAEELEALPEIGPAMARAIVEYREEHGPFEAVDDLLEVQGIGPKTLEAIEALITVR